MEIDIHAQQEEFNEEINELLHSNNQINIPQNLEILHLDELPDLSEWRKQ